MKYPLYELTDDEFEKLVALICSEILGLGTIIFSKGKDGGRDAKFTGIAQEFPSALSPWKGKFIIQAKHTQKPTASCSDSDFTSILKSEVEGSLTELVNQKMVDNYLLFTNRKLSGLKDPKINDFIITSINIQNQVIGIEQINLWLEKYQSISKILNLNKLLLPLQFYEKELKDIIINFHDSIQKISLEDEEKIINNQNYFEKMLLEDKNRLNNLSKEYFDFIKERSFLYFGQIKEFLENPINRVYKNYYDQTIDDLQELVLVNRNDYNVFEEVINFLYDYILNNNLDDLKSKRKLIRVFLHYMYFNCDIGIKESA